MISNQTHTSNTTELAETKQHKFHVKDPGSALTHFIAMIGAAIAAVPLLHKAAEEADSRHLAALAVFIISMILLYAASTTYHTFNISEHVNKILRKIDHMMIFILIAGTYTPVCLIVLENNAGYRLLALVFGEPAGGEVLREGLTGGVECLLARLGVELPGGLLVVFRGLSHVSSASYRVLSDSTLSFLGTY